MHKAALSVALAATAAVTTACTHDAAKPRTAPFATPAAKTGGNFSPLPVPTSTFTGPSLGTISANLAGGPWSSSDYLITNGWRNIRDGSLYRVFAGSVGGQPRQGIVIVIRGPAHDPTGAGHYRFRYVRTPVRDGALKMISANNWIIELKAADGARYLFDVLRQRLVR